MPAIEAVGFDFDHTLGFDHRLERTVALDVAREFARRRKVPFGDEHGAAFDVAIERYRSGAAPFGPTLAQYFADSVAAAHPTAEDLAALIVAFKSDSVRRAPDFVTAAPGTAAMLNEIAALGLRTAILTNGWSPLQEEKARLIGFAGPVLASDTIGARKPQPEAFAILARTLAAAPERIAYVGDDPAVDIGGATRAGMIAVWIDAEGRAYPSDVTLPAASIESLAGLASWLQGPSAQAANRAP